MLEANTLGKLLTEMTGSKVAKAAITIAGASLGQFIVKYLFYFIIYFFIFVVKAG